MPYPAISSRRIPYDIDGSAVALCNNIYSITSWVLSSQLSNLNLTEGLGNVLTGGPRSGGDSAVIIFFPEKVEVEQGFISGPTDTFDLRSIYGSNDTANGMDGTWETAVFPNGSPAVVNPNEKSWRESVKTISFSESKKVIKIQFYASYGGSVATSVIKRVHIYGRKASGETPDDILLCDINGNELTALMDWVDRPEGTTLIKSFKVKNASTTKIANNVNLQLNHADFLLSLDQITWVATLDIASIPANSLSAEIFVKNALGPPLLMLGPKAARIIATVGSFT